MDSIRNQDLIQQSYWLQIGTTKIKKTKRDHVPAMELIPVEQQQELVHRVSLPNPCSYAHGFRWFLLLLGWWVVTRLFCNSFVLS